MQRDVDANDRCLYCEKDQATKICLAHAKVQRLCDACVAIHNRIDEFKTHRVANIEEYMRNLADRVNNAIASTDTQSCVEDACNEVSLRENSICSYFVHPFKEITFNQPTNESIVDLRSNCNDDNPLKQISRTY